MQAPFSYSDVTNALNSLSRTEDGLALLGDVSVTNREGYEDTAGLLPYCKDAAQPRGRADWYFQGVMAWLLNPYTESPTTSSAKKCRS